jgi:hypothetical protein
VRAILASLILLFSAELSAQTILPKCPWWSTKASNLDINLIPSFTQFFASDSPQHSFVVSWWCDDKYGWSFFSLFGFKDQLDSDWQAKLKSITGDEAAMLLLATERISCPLEDRTTPGCERYLQLDPVWKLQRDSTKPAPIYWGIRDNPSSTTRPCFTYNATTGVRNTTAVPSSTCRVPDADDPATPDIRENWCTCTRRHIEESGGVYCDVGNLFNVGTAAVGDVTPFDTYVALCERKN